MFKYTLAFKSTSRPRATFSAETMAALLAARPEAASLTLARWSRQYKALTGKTVFVHPDQEAQLLNRFGANEQGHWTSRYSQVGDAVQTHLRNCFSEGFLADSSIAIDDALAIADEFFAMLDKRVGSGRG